MDVESHWPFRQVNSPNTTSLLEDNMGTLFYVPDQSKSSNTGAITNNRPANNKTPTNDVHVSQATGLDQYAYQRGAVSQSVRLSHFTKCV